MLTPPTQADIQQLLLDTLPFKNVTWDELAPAARSLLLLLRTVAQPPPVPAAKPAARKPRQYAPKSIADSQHLKR